MRRLRRLVSLVVSILIVSVTAVTRVSTATLELRIIMSSRDPVDVGVVWLTVDDLHLDMMVATYVPLFSTRCALSGSHARTLSLNRLLPANLLCFSTRARRKL